MDNVLARQQEIHDVLRRNTHQAQLRQKLKYGRAISARAYQTGELVWVYELDTGQKCHFEQLEPHQSGALEFVTASMDGGDMFC